MPGSLRLKSREGEIGARWRGLIVYSFPRQSLIRRGSIDLVVRNGSGEILLGQPCSRMRYIFIASGILIRKRG